MKKSKALVGEGVTYGSQGPYFKTEAERLGMENIDAAGDLEIWIYIICKHHNKDFDIEFKRIKAEINEQI